MNVANQSKRRSRFAFTNAVRLVSSSAICVQRGHHFIHTVPFALLAADHQVDRDEDQLDPAGAHRVRQRFVGQRASIINQIRAFPLGRGIAIWQGLGERLGILATRSAVMSPGILRLVEDLAGDWRHLDARIEGLSGEIDALA